MRIYDIYLKLMANFNFKFITHITLNVHQLFILIIYLRTFYEFEKYFTFFS